VIPALLILALAVALALFVAACATDTVPDDRDTDPAPLPPAADLLVGAHAAPVGRARVPDPGQTLDPPVGRPYVGRHGGGVIGEEPALVRPAFAAVMNLGRGSDR
jgi:hypothetical protein